MGSGFQATTHPQGSMMSGAIALAIATSRNPAENQSAIDARNVGGVSVSPIRLGIAANRAPNITTAMKVVSCTGSLLPVPQAQCDNTYPVSSIVSHSTGAPTSTAIQISDERSEDAWGRIHQEV